MSEARIADRVPAKIELEAVAGDQVGSVAVGVHELE